MKQFKENGVTIILVSHAINTIRDFCNKSYIYQQPYNSAIMTLESLFQTCMKTNKSSVPTLSIIISVYNTEKYIESVFNLFDHNLQ